MDFNNKVCIVTGGANGIGRAIVEQFLQNGANVIFIDIDNEAAEKLVAKHGEKLTYFSGDITNEEIITNFVKMVLKRFKHVDYLINNACVSRNGILSKCSYDDFNYVLKLGVTAPYLLTMLLQDYFNSDAAIVNISSSRATMSQKDTESYSAAKGGISALTHALSISLAGKVRVNSISPGWIDTGAFGELSREDHLQHPVRRVGTPLDIAKMVLYLCSDASSFITGENITIDGGMSKQMIYHGEHGWSYTS
ncbi:SDR family oxidoreductase [Calidifontibacillus oryziterrae]|uniref:SDR family oxidoreductase n=1 Tax=Calidifontibacillus oryziterrae TaxID=1191699 RepID=UPI000301BFFA|nr:SDR family oxidoreductase [Calidifontibacillus oryziterrae]